MNIDSDKIASLLQLAMDGSFSKASKNLHLSQPALSKKIRRLEAEFGTTLVIRDRKGVLLTDFGQRVIRYARARQCMDQELMQSISYTNSANRGEVRIACYSSIARSAVLPCLSEILVGNSRVHVDLMSRELRELPGLLLSSSVDFILTTTPIKKNILTTEIVGKEEFVHIRPSLPIGKGTAILPYLDHDADDETTLQFLERQKLDTNVERNFYDDIYLILDAVELGLGQAIVSKHLITGRKNLTVVKHPKKMIFEIYLQFYLDSYQPKMKLDVLHTLKHNLSKYL